MGGEKDKGREERGDEMWRVCKATKKEGYHKDIPLIGGYTVCVNAHLGAECGTKIYSSEKPASGL